MPAGGFVLLQVDGCPRSLPAALAALLKAPTVLKVGVNVHGDASRLAADFSLTVASAHNVQAENLAILQLMK